MSTRNNVSRQQGHTNSSQNLTPQQQMWKILSFHETRLNNIDNTIDVILRALPWEARLEATDVEKYRKVETKLEGIEKELGALKEDSVTSEILDSVERNIEENCENNFTKKNEDVLTTDLSPVDYLRQEELMEGKKSGVSVSNKETLRGKRRGKKVTLEINE